MLNFENFDIAGFISRRIDFYRTTINIVDNDIIKIMTLQRIRKTKKNIEVCTSEFLKHIEQNINRNKNEWKLFSAYGDHNFKR